MTADVSSNDDIVLCDRSDAGRRLANALDHYRSKPATVVLGLPRGGVVTAAEVASALGLPLDVVISRKIGAPGNPELAIGAVAEDGDPYLNDEVVTHTGASAAYIDAEVARQRAEIARRRDWFRGGKPLVLPGRATVILVDDGVATGATVIAAIRALRQLEVERLVVAVPVAPPETAGVLLDLADELVVLAIPAMFWAVGEFYRDFAPVSDEEVSRLLGRAARTGESAPLRRKNQCFDVTIEADGVALLGELGIPSEVRGIVLFAHGSGSGRLSPRNRHVAQLLRQDRFATLLFDLLGEDEAQDRRNVFDVGLLARRLRIAADWVRRNERTGRLPMGYFGASTGAAAALIAAATDRQIGAVVSRGGRPDLAESALPRVTAPTLLIVGGEDDAVIGLNEQALASLRCVKELRIVEGASHLFEEPGALDQVADLAARWFARHLAAQSWATNRS